jgi:hypothetical protein
MGAGTPRLGTPGDDYLSGSGSKDSLDGLAGDDGIYGRGGDDRLVGGDGNDTLKADGGNDTLDGGAGRDQLTGGQGDDVLDGGAGNDRVSGGPGSDTITGGAGADTFLFWMRTNGAPGLYDVVNDLDFSEGDRLRLDTATLTGFRAMYHNGLVDAGFSGVPALDDPVWLRYASIDTQRELYGLVNLLQLTAGASVQYTDPGPADVVLLSLDFDGDRSLDQFIELRGWGERLDRADGQDDDVISLIHQDPDDPSSPLVDVPGGIIASLRRGPSLDLSTLDGSDGFRLDGADPDSQTGSSVGPAGDVNGDGFDDIVIGAPLAGFRGHYSGSAYVVFGSAGGFAPSLSLSALDGSNGFRLDGVSPEDHAGSAAHSAGDVNGDGFDDVIIGAYNADSDGLHAGSAYVVFGKARGFAPSLNFAALNGSNGFRLDGVEAIDIFGRSVDSAGDVNGDGFDDLVIGALNADPNGLTSGAAYVVFGRWDGFAATLDVSALNGSDGFRLDGTFLFDSAGQSVSSAGDVNGDGYDDLIVGAPGADFNGSRSGSAYVVFGRADGFTRSVRLSSLDGENGFRLDGVHRDDAAGSSVSSAGDVNGDGFDDLVISAPGADAPRTNSGSVYVVFGKEGGFAPSLSLGELDGGDGFRLDGLWDRTGWSVSSAGDVNGDGFHDLIIGAPFAGLGQDIFSGSAYVVFGKAGGFEPALRLSALDGSNGFRLEGEAELQYAGSSVSAAGDVNGDGFDDLLVGAPWGDPNNPYPGSAYVVFGSDFTGAVTFLGSAAGETLTGTAAGERFVAGQGEDTLIGGGGADVLSGGEGDDVIRLGADLPFRVDGGSGTDILDLSALTAPIDLRTLADNRITGVEKLDLAGGGADALTLAPRDVFALPDHLQPVTISGDAEDAVTLIGAWLAASSSAGYTTLALGEAQLRIDQDITTHILLV